MKGNGVGNLHCFILLWEGVAERNWVGLVAMYESYKIRVYSEIRLDHRSTSRGLVTWTWMWNHI